MDISELGLILLRNNQITIANPTIKNHYSKGIGAADLLAYKEYRKTLKFEENFRVKIAV